MNEYEPIQIDTGVGMQLVSKPKESLNLFNYKDWIKWKEITIYPYDSKRETMPFISIKNRVLFAYNYGKYRWFTIFSEICKFLDVEWHTLDYHLKKVKKEGHPYFKGNRDNYSIVKKFYNEESPQEYILIIPYETFWALLESYKSVISKNILKELHKIDYERMMEDDRNQTLIEQIKGAIPDYKKLCIEWDKCETNIQKLAFFEIFRFYHSSKVEKWKWQDKIPDKKRRKWSIDIIIEGFKMAIECDGSQHRFDDKRFEEDEEKDTFLFKKGYYVFRRSNDWWRKSYREFPIMLAQFIENNQKIFRKKDPFINL